MTRDRRFEILDQIKEWQLVNSDTSIVESMYQLYSDHMITPNELDYLIDWMTL